MRRFSAVPFGGHSANVLDGPPPEDRRLRRAEAYHVDPALDETPPIGLPVRRPEARCKQAVRTCLRNAPNGTNAKGCVIAGQAAFQQPRQPSPTLATAQMDGLKIRPVSVRVRLGARSHQANTFEAVFRTAVIPQQPLQRHSAAWPPWSGHRNTGARTGRASLRPSCGRAWFAAP
jgi:hypothetical protein